MGELLGVSWDNYKDSMTGNLRSLIRDEDFIDVSLHCEGRTLKAHKVYLSACSEYFRNVLRGTNLWQHPILFLSEIPFGDLQKILEFIYCGEVQIPQKKLGSFLKSAEILKINGLKHSVRQNRTEEHTNNFEYEEHLILNRRKKRRKESDDSTVCRDQFSVMQNPDNTNNSENADRDLPGEIDLGEQVIVKADPEDFQEQDENQFVNNLVEDHQDDETGAHRGIGIRNDLLSSETAHQNQAPMYGERGRCHFCQLLCLDRAALTEHLKASHQPPKHALCENCENFFHICAITRHRDKCRARYQTDK